VASPSPSHPLPLDPLHPPLDSRGLASRPRPSPSSPRRTFDALYPALWSLRDPPAGPSLSPGGGLTTRYLGEGFPASSVFPSVPPGGGLPAIVSQSAAFLPPETPRRGGGGCLFRKALSATAHPAPRWAHRVHRCSSRAIAILPSLRSLCRSIVRSHLFSH